MIYSQRGQRHELIELIPVFHGLHFREYVSKFCLQVLKVILVQWQKHFRSVLGTNFKHSIKIPFVSNLLKSAGHKMQLFVELCFETTVTI